MGRCCLCIATCGDVEEEDEKFAKAKYAETDDDCRRQVCTVCRNRDWKICNRRRKDIYVALSINDLYLLPPTKLRTQHSGGSNTCKLGVAGRLSGGRASFHVRRNKDRAQHNPSGLCSSRPARTTGSEQVKKAL